METGDTLGVTTFQRGSVQIGQAVEKASQLTLTSEHAVFDSGSSQSLPGSEQIPQDSLEKPVLKIPQAMQPIVLFFQPGLIHLGHDPLQQRSPLVEMVEWFHCHFTKTTVSGSPNVIAASGCWLRRLID